MPIEAWYMDGSDEDQRLPHKTDPVEPVPIADLAALGVLSWSGITVLAMWFTLSFPHYSYL